MNEREIKAFIDSLAASERHDDTAESLTAEQAALSSLWHQMADLPAEDMENPTSVSKFQKHLEVYKQGWYAAHESIGRPRRRSRFAQVAGYGLAACIAIALFFSGMLTNRSIQQRGDLQQELATTREMLSLALLNHSSASQRIAGLVQASQLPTSSPELKRAILWRLDKDPNLTVQLAALETLALLAPEDAVDLLMDRLAEKDSPLLQLEMLRVAELHATPGQLQEMRSLMLEKPLKPSIKAYLQGESSDI